MRRILSIDITRGIVMIIMALDHVRDLLHVDSIVQSPTNLATTTPALFFTRWITYLCAPIFVFLSGTSAFLSLHRKKDMGSSRRFLFQRGVWMLLLEFTVVNFGMFFDPGFHLLMFEVIGAFGFGFIVLGLLLRWSPKAIGILGLVIIFGHDLSSLLQLKNGVMATIFNSLFSLNSIPLGASRVLVIGYPPVPWLGIMLTGFAIGPVFLVEEARRRKLFMLLGIGSLILFAVLRYSNRYGDPFQWSTQKTAVFTFLSFMNISKYPPSLLFCLVTLGIMFLLLFLTERAGNWFTRKALIYGKVPLFYFILHFYLIHVLLIVVLFVQGLHWNQFDFASGGFGRPRNMVTGIPLWAVYLVWIAVVAALYRPCVWYSHYKMTHKQWWLRFV